MLGLLPNWPIEHVLGRLIQQLTSAFAEHELTFPVHSSAPPARPLREIWKAVTPAAVLALDGFPEGEVEADAMRAAGIEVVMAAHGSAQGERRFPTVSRNRSACCRHAISSPLTSGSATPSRT
ncbi:hypothetical protein ACKI1I_21140 [Streptomyces turgidiscabies]|uniref:hypothetical protein n=1 Tax=Streptomyces TaxID=1883 RepID=UPI0002FF1F5D|nr:MULTISPECIES: hypothetical protein [Streptomyces]MDX3496579.1 hypothetical protein [Streptomyces turgidiscabies]